MNPSSPTHEEITRRAQAIWEKRGRPAGCDPEIWLEAERQLVAGTPEPAPESPTRETPRTVSESKGAGALADRIKSETAAESVVEYHISPAGSDNDAVKAALQTNASAAPKRSSRNGPRVPPPASGKRG